MAGRLDSSSIKQNLQDLSGMANYEPPFIFGPDKQSRAERKFEKISSVSWKSLSFLRWQT